MSGTVYSVRWPLSPELYLRLDQHRGACRIGGPARGGPARDVLCIRRIVLHLIVKEEELHHPTEFHYCFRMYNITGVGLMGSDAAIISRAVPPERPHKANVLD